MRKPSGSGRPLPFHGSAMTTTPTKPSTTAASLAGVRRSDGSRTRAKRTAAIGVVALPIPAIAEATPRFADDEPRERQRREKDRRDGQVSPDAALPRESRPGGPQQDREDQGTGDNRTAAIWIGWRAARATFISRKLDPRSPRAAGISPARRHAAGSPATASVTSRARSTQARCVCRAPATEVPASPHAGVTVTRPSVSHQAEPVDGVENQPATPFAGRRRCWAGTRHTARSPTRASRPRTPTERGWHRSGPARGRLRPEARSGMGAPRHSNGGRLARRPR